MLPKRLTGLVASQQAGVFFALIIIFIVSCFLSPYFLTSFNMLIISRALAFVGMVTIAQALPVFETLELTEREHLIASRVLREIRDRLRFLVDVGVGYLTLARGAVLYADAGPLALWASCTAWAVGTLVVGFQRAAFSNEAGVGSAAIAHSAAKTPYPVREGIVALLEPFIDTIVICTMTALVIVMSARYFGFAGAPWSSSCAVTKACPWKSATWTLPPLVPSAPLVPLVPSAPAAPSLPSAPLHP